MNRVPELFPLGERLDYSARVAQRRAEGLPDGSAVTIDVDGGPLTIRRLGAGYHVTGAGQPDGVLTADDMAAVVWAAVLEHVQRRQAAAASAPKGAASVKAA